MLLDLIIVQGWTFSQGVASEIWKRAKPIAHWPKHLRLLRFARLQWRISWLELSDGFSARWTDCRFFQTWHLSQLSLSFPILIAFWRREANSVTIFVVTLSAPITSASMFLIQISWVWWVHWWSDYLCSTVSISNVGWQGDFRDCRRSLCAKHCSISFLIIWRFTYPVIVMISEWHLGTHRLIAFIILSGLLRVSMVLITTEFIFPRRGMLTIISLTSLSNSSFTSS